MMSADNNIQVKEEAGTATQMLHGDVAPLVSGTPSPDGQFDLGDLVVIQRKVLGVIGFWISVGLNSVESTLFACGIKFHSMVNNFDSDT